MDGQGHCVVDLKALLELLRIFFLCPRKGADPAVDSDLALHIFKLI